MKRVNNISLLKQSLEAMYRGRFIRKVVSFGLVCTLSFSSLTFNPNISRLTIFATEETVTTTEENNDTTEAEIAFSLQFLEHLPKPGESGFEKFTKLPDQSKFEENRENTIRHKDNSTEVITINEKEVYAQIEATVKELIEKVESRTPSEDMTDEVIKADDNYSSHYELPKEMRIAKAIYRWVAKNISYDDESYEATVSKGKSNASRKPQDALFVFSQKTGVCEGYARLTDLMMKISGIPCTYLSSIHGKYEDIGHAFNAVYINDTANNRQGWTLIDSTWASPKSDKDRSDDRVKNYLNEGTASFYPNIFEMTLDRHDEYMQELEKELKFTYEETENFDDGDIKELNHKTEQLLNRLNDKYEGRKFESIEFLKGKYGLDVKYKNNITLGEAIEIIEKEKTKEEEMIKNSFIDRCIQSTAGIFNWLKPEIMEFSFLDELNHTNSLINQDSKEKSQEYTEKVKDFYTDCINKYSENIENKLNEVNDEIKTKLDLLNSEYQNIITFKQLSVKINEFDYLHREDDSKTWLYLNVTTSISREKAESIYEKEEKYRSEEKASLVNSKIEMYFPAFYNTNMTLEEANKSIIIQSTHKIACLSEDIGPNRGFEIDGVIYELSGNETKAYISMKGDYRNPAENVIIPEELLKLLTYLLR